MRLAVLGSTVAVLAVVGGGVVAGVVAQDEGATARPVVRAPDDAVPVPMELAASRYGLEVRADVRVREATAVTGPFLRGADEEVEGRLWPLDGRDHEGEDLSRVPLAAGDQVEVSGYLSPDCGGPDPAAGDLLVSLAAPTGREPDRTLTFVLDDAAALDAAVADWCSLGPSVEPTGSMTSPDGTGEAYLAISNPGPGSVEVSLPAGAGWEAASISVPAGTVGADLTLRASSADCDAEAVLPWADGRLQVNGEPYPITLEDGWCG